MTSEAINSNKTVIKRFSVKITSISLIASSIWLLRILFAVMLIFLIFRSWKVYDKAKDVFGKWQIWDKEYNLILPEYIEHFYTNPQKYIDFNRCRAQYLLDLAWPDANPKVRFLPIKEKRSKNGIDWADTNSVPVVTFYYDDEGEKSVDCNVKFIDKIADIALKRGLINYYDRNRNFIENTARINLVDVLHRCDEYPVWEDSIRRTQSDVVFSYNEMKKLKLNAGVMLTLIGIIIQTHEFRPDISRGIDSLRIEITLDELKSEFMAIPKHWIIAHAYYFNKHHRPYLESQKKMRRLSFLMYFAGFFLIFFLFIKPGSLIFIQRELKKREIQLSWNTPESLLLFRIIHLWFLPVNTSKSKARIKKVCSAIREIQTNNAIRQEATLLERILNQYSDPVKASFSLYGDIKTKVKIAAGRTKKRKAASAERQIALMGIIDGIEKLSEIQTGIETRETTRDTSIDTVSLGTTTEVETKKISRQESAFELVKKRLPDGFEFKQLSLWNAGELERLALALLILPEMHPKAVKAFLSNDNIRGLLSKRSYFMEALSDRNKDLIIETLKLQIPIKEQETAYNIKEYSDLLKDTNVVLIGGGKLQSKRNQLSASLGRLGVKSKLPVYDPFEDFRGLRENINTVAENTLYLLYARGTNHSAMGLLEKKKRKYITFESISEDKFLSEVIDWYGIIN